MGTTISIAIRITGTTTTTTETPLTSALYVNRRRLCDFF